MKKKILICLLIFIASAGMAQSKYTYDDFFYYRHHLYLRTSSVLLNAASSKMIAGDTAEAIRFVKEAASKGMYDTMYIVSKSRLRFIAATPHWAAIKKQIESNNVSFSSPENMQVLTTDIDNFWKIFDKIANPGADKLLMNEYIMKGSPGLRTLFEVRMGVRITSLLDAVRKQKKYYESIRPVSRQLYTFRPRMIEAARKLKDLYPAAIFPPTSFVIGNMDNFGTADGGAGQLIGAEFLCDTNSVSKEELGDWQKTVITDTSRLLGIIIHELIHIEQQTAYDNTLLSKAINEGAADFITQLVLGYNPNSKIYIYGNLHENELWEKFNKQMNGDDTSEWLYNGISAKSVPGDLGYYMGYKICEAYYNKATEKKQAVKDILEIQDFKKFLKLSGYSPAK